jgi:hypothetical protein
MVLLVEINQEHRIKLSNEWKGEYSYRMSYPFFQWVIWKYNATLIRSPEHPFAFEFKTEEDKNRFLEKWD